MHSTLVEAYFIWTIDKEVIRKRRILVVQVDMDRFGVAEEFGALSVLALLTLISSCNILTGSSCQDRPACAQEAAMLEHRCLPPHKSPCIIFLLHRVYARFARSSTPVGSFQHESTLLFPSSESLLHVSRPVQDKDGVTYTTWFLHRTDPANPLVPSTNAMSNTSAARTCSQRIASASATSSASVATTLGIF